jgi:hypothetical protein
MGTPKKKWKSRKAKPVNVPRRGLSIAEFCGAYGITRQLLYPLWREGRGPAFMMVGRRRIITGAEQWQAAREREAAEYMAAQAL